jgi:hypothetical protein
LKRNGSAPGRGKNKPSVVQTLASNPSTDAARVEQLLRAMRSIAEMADSALRDDHRLLYFAQMARQAEAATAPSRAVEPRNGEPRDDPKDLPA